MKGDFSKKSFDANKHYKDVNMQQGRVLLDTDWNEQNDITGHRIETETIDTIGIAGAPMHDAGFGIIPVDNAGNPVASNGVDLKISAGRFYTDGLLCENETTLFYKSQPDFPGTSLPSQPADAGDYMLYLDVWERHITAFEDAAIREVALNGADTTTRTKTVWQVKYKKMTSPITCLTNLPADVLGPTDAQRGKINAKTEADSSTGGPCGLVTSGGYKGLANQLYRVEIHKAGTRATATFKWSRENASVLATWESIDAGNPNNLMVKNPGRDDLLGFKSGDWVELIGDRTDLLITPGVLVKLASVEGTVLTIDSSTIRDPEGSPGTAVARVFGYKNPRIRRWDMQKDKAELEDNGEIELKKSVWIELEDGVQVQFIAGAYLSGDYWLIPARTTDAKIEWPFTTPQLPLGIKHHYARLAICTLSFSGNTPQWTKISDCRPIFPPLTELISVFYAGGDGQEGIPDQELNNTLKVGVSNGRWPLEDAEITFEVISGGGKFLPGNLTSITAKTNVNGIAECRWQLGPEAVPQQNQVVVAKYIRNLTELVHLPITFSAKQIPPTMFYVGGDGQEAAPGTELKYKLKVGVAHENVPVPDGAKVEFNITKGGGSFTGGTSPQTTIVSTINGVAECVPWKLGPSGKQEVTATFLDVANNPGTNVKIVFSATVVTASNGKCSYTIGKNGDFPTLEDAFNALKQEKNICLCLMAPLNDDEHIIKDLKVEGKDSIKITACGATIKMEGNWLMAAGKITLQGFAVEAKEKMEIILLTRELLVDRCEFTRINDNEDNPFITIEGSDKTTKVNWSLNRISGGSLALDTGVSGWINDNGIAGNIILHHREKFDLGWKINEDQRKEIQVKLRNALSIVNPEFLYICGNVLNKVVTRVPEKNLPEFLLQSDNPVTIPGLGNLIVSRNIFNNGVSGFLANLVTLSDNHFINTKRNTVVAFALGHLGSFVGNIDPLFNNDTGAIIDAIFDFGRETREPNQISVI